MNKAIRIKNKKLHLPHGNGANLDVILGLRIKQNALKAALQPGTSQGIIRFRLSSVTLLFEGSIVCGFCLGRNCSKRKTHGESDSATTIKTSRSVKYFTIITHHLLFKSNNPTVFFQS